MKKAISFLCLLALLATLCACAPQPDTEKPDDKPDDNAPATVEKQKPHADTEEAVAPEKYDKEPKEDTPVEKICLHEKITTEKTATGCVCTCDVCGETVTYDVTPTEGLEFVPMSSTTCTLVGKGSWDGMGDLVVPAYSPEGLLVTVVGEKAFEKNSTMTSCTLPPTVRQIGGMAFFYCTEMEVLNLPAWLTVLDGGALWDCRALKSLILPDTLTELGVQSVYECSSLAELRLSRSITEIGAQTFDSICVKGLVIPDNITKIDDFAFCRCNGMETVVIPDSVTYLGHDTFSRSSTIKTITVGKGITSVGAQAFDQNPALESITFTGKITSFPDSCFAGDESLILTIPSSVTQIGNSALKGIKGVVLECTNKAYKLDGDFLMTVTGKTAVAYFGTSDNVTVPEGTVILAPYLFAGKALTSVTLPDSVTTVGDGAFYGCKNLSTLSVSDNVTYIGDKALFETSSLKSVTVGQNNAVYEIKNGCLYETVTNVLVRGFNGSTIPNTTYKICADAFCGADEITEITLPKSVKEIGDYALLHAESLEKITYEGTKTEYYTIRRGNEWFNEKIIDGYTSDGTFN